MRSLEMLPIFHQVASIKRLRHCRSKGMPEALPVFHRVASIRRLCCCWSKGPPEVLPVFHRVESVTRLRCCWSKGPPEDSIGQQRSPQQPPQRSSIPVVAGLPNNINICMR